MKICRGAFIIAFILLFSVFAKETKNSRASSPEIKDKATLKSGIQKQKNELENLAEKEKETVANLDALSEKVVTLSDILDSLDKEDSLLGMRLTDLGDSLSKSNASLDSARTAQAKVVRAMFIRGRAGELTFLLQSDGVGDFVNRLGYFIFLARARRELGDRLENISFNIKIIADSTEVVKNRVAQTKNLRLSELDSLNAAKAGQKKLLDKIRNDEGTYRAAIAEMERSLQELTDRIPAPKKGGNFESNKGKLPWPTDSRNVLYKFGIVKESRFGTTFRNSGIDIATKPEADVRSVADGTVAQISWLRGYGNIVILEHAGGFFSVYGNLGKVDVSEGQNLSARARIGKTAEEGWLEGSKLHLEIRNGRREVNPLDWLVSR